MVQHPLPRVFAPVCVIQNLRLAVLGAELLRFGVKFANLLAYGIGGADEHVAILKRK